MNVEHQTSLTIFNSLAHVMGVLRRSAIVLEKLHGVRRVTLDALPVFADRPPAFRFILDAELATVTVRGQCALRLAIGIELRGEHA